MKRISYSAVVVGVVAATGVVVAGCSGGGGGGGGGSTLPPISVGSVSTNLPTYTPDSQGYSFGSTQLNTTRGGKVTALGVAPTDTSVFAGHFPLARVDLVNNDVASASGTFFYDAQSIVAVGTLTFAGTGNPARAGAGDIYEFRNGAWSVSLNSADGEVVVGAVNSSAWAASGGVNRGGALLQWDTTTNRWATVAALDSYIPTALTGHQGDLWLGATGNSGQGGSARLFHRSPVTGQLDEVSVPGAGGGFGIRQEISSMVSIASANSANGASVGSEILVFSVASFDVATNAPLSGLIVATDGSSFEVMHSFADDAPTAIAFHDNTVFVGTGKGRLYLRDQFGAFVEETLPAGLTRIEALLSHDRDRAALHIGGSSATGAYLVRRAGNSGYTPPVTDRYYNPDVRQLLLSSCASCHAGGALPAASSVYGLSAGLTNNTADSNATRAKVDLANPANSLLIRKALGMANHLGGALIQSGSVQHNMLLAYVAQGARLEATVTPPPQTNRTWVTDIAPIFANLQCTGCHNGNAGGYRLITGGGGMADFTETLQEVNLTTPENSAILRFPSQTGVSHAGGTRYAQGSANYNTILLWIQQGARYQ